MPDRLRCLGMRRALAGLSPLTVSEAWVTTEGEERAGEVVQLV